MANNIGTLVTAAVRPFSEADKFPTAYGNEILGGLKTCQSITERNTIPTERLTVGTLVYVADTDLIYFWNGTSFDTGKKLSKNDYDDTDKTSVSSINQYITYPLTMVNGKYINFAGTGEAMSDIRCYTTIINDGSKHFITSTIGGSAMKLLFFYDTNNNLISTQYQGNDTGVNTPFTDLEIQFPNNCAYYKVNGFVASGGVILKKKQNMFSYLGNVLSSNMVQTPTSDIEGKYPWNNASIHDDATKKYATYNILPTDILRISTAIGGSAMWAVVYLNSANQVVGYENKGRDGFVDFYNDYQLTIPVQATKMYLSGVVGQNYNLTKYTVFTKAVSTAQLSTEQERITKLENGSSNLLSGKIFLHFGTSIPEGGRYPTDGPESLGGVGINMAVGSSTARISRADGSYNGLAYQNFMYALARKKSEIQTLIDTWDTIKGSLSNNPPDVLTDAEKTKMLACSYEYRLLPYLDGTKPMPDFFIFDHGRNDGYSNDLSVIPAQRDDRRYFIGAMNYLIDLILKYNKFARIAFVGHYENDLLTPVSQAQEVLADYWGFPLLKLWEKTGFSQQIVQGSKSLWTQEPWSNYTNGQNTTLDINRQRIYLPDGIHPHAEGADKNASKLLTKIYANFIKDLV